MATVTKKRKYRKSRKIRKNSVQGKHDARTRLLQSERIWMVCRKCEMSEQLGDPGVTAFTCARCVVRMVPFPVLPKRLTVEEKANRTARRDERRKRKEAEARGESPPTRQDLGFGRGWHKKVLFQTGTNGATEYYTRGEQITKKEYDRLNRQTKKAAKAKKKNSFGRGWHFKAEFIAPNGDRYEKGKLVEKA